MGRLEVENLSRAKAANSLDVTPLRSVEYTYPRDQAPSARPFQPAAAPARAAAPEAPAAAPRSPAPPAQRDQTANAAVMERVRELVAAQPQPDNSFWTIR
jgi:adhesin transport system outer membrane protein